MNKILLVEDSNMFGRLAKAKLESVFQVPVSWLKTREETVEVLKRGEDTYSIALVDVNLPDAPGGEAIDDVVARGISTFVFTSDITKEVRQLVWSKKVADYILKDDPNSLEHIIQEMQRVANNVNNLILLVDGSEERRTMLAELLYVQQYRVIAAKNGEAAFRVLEQYPEIKLVIVEYELPDIDGWGFCQKIRESYKKEDLAIIGVVSQGGKDIGVRFIKSGASDFVETEKLIIEEFFCRVRQAIEMINLIREIKRDGSD